VRRNDARNPLAYIGNIVKQNTHIYAHAHTLGDEDPSLAIDAALSSHAIAPGVVVLAN
jgi:hypothetical protein